MGIQNRNIATSILFSIITCGIYGIIWAYKASKEATSVANDEGTLEAILSIFFMPVGLFLTEKKFAEGCAMRNIPHKDNSIIYIVLGFCGLGLVGLALLQKDLNELAPVQQ